MTTILMSQEVRIKRINGLYPTYTPFISRWNNPFTNHLIRFIKKNMVYEMGWEMFPHFVEAETGFPIL